MIDTTTETNHKIDLTNCDREPIHIPGSIQPHGVIFAIAEPGLTILQTSVNSAEMLGFSPEDLIGETWEKILTADSVEHLKSNALPKNLKLCRTTCRS